jgi:iron complex outermembrane recepter protein
MRTSPPRACTRKAITVLLAGALASAGPANEGNEGRLKRLSLEQLGNIEVTIVSKQPVRVSRTPAAVYVLTQDDIRQSGVTSFPEILRLVPGVEVARIDSVKWSVGVRGFGSRLSRKVLVLIDGRSVYSPLFAGVYWEVQNTLLEDIERIEVIRGPGGTIWGSNSMNGVINIVTRNARETHGMLLSAGGGNVDQGVLGFRQGGGGKHFDYRVYGKAFTRGPQFHPDDRQFDDTRMGQGGFRTDSELSVRDTLTVQGDFYTGLAGTATSYARISPPGRVVLRGNAEFSGGNALGRWRRALGAGSDLQIQVSVDRTRREDLTFHETRKTFDVDLLHSVPLPKGHALLWGLGARLSAGRFPAVVPENAFQPDRHTAKLYSAFIQDEIPLVEDRLSLTIGSKFVHSDYSGFDVAPSVRLLWTPATQHTVWASVTRAVRTPSEVEEIYRPVSFVSANPLTYAIVSGDERFRAETLLGYEAGFRTLLHSKFYLDLAAFYNKYDELLSVEAGTPFEATSPTPAHRVIPYSFRNELFGATSGFEIAPTWKPVKPWRLAGSYSYLHMDLDRRPGSVDANSVRSAVGASPRHQIVFQSFLDLPRRFEFSQTYRHVSGLPSQGVAGYHTGDLRFGWRPIPLIEFSVAGQNLLQPHHPEFGGNPGGLVGIKRSVYASITWRK